MNIVFIKYFTIIRIIESVKILIHKDENNVRYLLTFNNLDLARSIPIIMPRVTYVINAHHLS